MPVVQQPFYNFRPSVIGFGCAEGKTLNFNTYIQDHPDMKFKYDFDARVCHSPSGKRNFWQKLFVFPNRVYQALTRHNPLFLKLKKMFKKKPKSKKEEPKKKNWLKRTDEKIAQWLYKKFPKLKAASEAGSGCVYANAGHPSCSEGMIILIDHYGEKGLMGTLKGVWKGFQRVGRCNVSNAIKLKEEGKLEESVYCYA